MAYNENLDRVRVNLLRAGYTPPDYEQFARDMADDKNLEKVRQTLIREGYTPPEFSKFKADMGFGSTAKPSSTPTTPTAPAAPSGGEQGVAQATPKQAAKPKKNAVPAWKFRAGMQMAGVNPYNPSDNRVSRMSNPARGAKRRMTNAMKMDDGRMAGIGIDEATGKVAMQQAPKPTSYKPDVVMSQMLSETGGEQGDAAVQRVREGLPEHYTWLQNRMGDDTDQYIKDMALFSALDNDLGNIYGEEKEAQRAREDAAEEASRQASRWSDPDDALTNLLIRETNKRRAGNTSAMLDRAVSRALSESKAAREYYDRRVRSHLDEGKSELQANAIARAELRNMFRDREIMSMMPKSDADYVAQSVFMGNMAAMMGRASIAMGSGDRERDRMYDEALETYRQYQAGMTARVAAPVLTLMYDIVSGGFYPAGAASKFVGTGVMRMLPRLGQRALGISAEMATRRIAGNTMANLATHALSGAANFGVYEMESTALRGMAQGGVSIGDVGMAGLKGAGKGFVFGIVGGTMGKATEGLSGWKALLGEAGTIAAEGTTFTALDYLSTGELTPEMVGTSFGMALGGRAAHPIQYAAGLYQRVSGKAPGVTKAPRLSDDEYSRLHEQYPGLSELMRNDGLARDLMNAYNGKAKQRMQPKDGSIILFNPNSKTEADRTLDVLAAEYEGMKNDPNVPWSVIRIAEYMLNGNVMPQPSALGWRVRVEDSGKRYGETLDQSGRVIERYALNDEAEERKWAEASSMKVDRNMVAMARQSARQAQYDEIVRGLCEEVGRENGWGSDVLYDQFKRQTIDNEALKNALEDIKTRADAAIEGVEDPSGDILAAVEEKYGVKLEDVLSKPSSGRTAEEQGALEEFVQRLSGDYPVEADMTDEEIAEREISEARQRGYDADEQERRDIAIEATDASEGDPAYEAWNGMVQRINDDANEIADAARERARQMQHSDGSIHVATLKEQDESGQDKVVYVVDGNVQMLPDGTMIDAANSDRSVVIYDPATGERKMIDPTADTGILSLGDVISAEDYEAAIENDRQAYIQLQLDDAMGVVRVLPGDQITLPTGDDAVVLAIDDTGENITVQLADGTQTQVSLSELQRAADDAAMADYNERHGIVDEAPAEEPQQSDGATLGAPTDYTGGMELTVRDEDGIEKPAMVMGRVRYEDGQFVPDENGNIVEYLMDGDVIHDHIDALGDKVVSYSPVERSSDGDEAAVQETGAADVVPPVEAPVAENAMRPVSEEPVIEDAQDDAMPMVEVKGKMKPDWYTASPQRSHQYIFTERGLSVEDAKQFVQNMRTAADDELKKLEKKKPKIGTDIDEYEEKLNAWEQQVAATRAQHDYWEAVAAEQASIEQEIVAEQAQEAASRQAAQQAEAERKAAEEAAAIERARQEREALQGVPDWVNDTPADARARGYRNVNGERVERQGESGGVYGREGSVKFSTKDVVPSRMKVIEADELQPSHIGGQRNPYFFLDEGQPKNRTDQASRGAREEIAGNINPEEITGDGGAYQFTAPTVNTRNETTQGNNRADALKLMWSSDRYKDSQERYRQYLIDHAGEFGLDADAILSMRKPVQVNEINVSDDEAIRLGQMSAKDLESGGIERIDPVTTVRKLGAQQMRSFASVLLRSDDDEASLRELIAANGEGALKWLGERDIISPTQRQSAFDMKGALTEEAKMDLMNILKQSLFQGGVSDLPRMFGAMPAKAQRAILATFMRDFDSAPEDRILPEIQHAIEVWYAAATATQNDEKRSFGRASNYKEAADRIMGWGVQMKIGDTERPIDNFSNFAVELAIRFQGLTMSNMQQQLNNFFDMVQGVGMGNLFDGGVSGVKYGLDEAREKTFGDNDYKTTNDNGQERSQVVGSDTDGGQTGERGEPADAGSPEPVAPGAGPADNRTGVAADARGGRVVEEPADNGDATAVNAAIAQAEADTDPAPTDAQKEAGNYKKGHVRIDGFDISIENPKGSERSGVDADGNRWSITMQNTYGYIRGTEGVDGDHIDVFLSDNPSEGNVYVVDQVNKDGSFDEHKVMYGFSDTESARKAYLSNYSPGWTGLGAITPVSKEEFKKWIASSHRKTKPFADYVSVKTLGDTQLGEQPPYTIEPTSYTNKKGKTTPMHLVTFGRELSRDEIRAGKELAKESRGWWDREKGGFMMRSEESAKQLAERVINAQYETAQTEATESTTDVAEQETVATADNGGAADVVKMLSEEFKVEIGKSANKIEIVPESAEDGPLEGIANVTVNGRQSNIWLAQGEGRTMDEYWKRIFVPFADMEYQEIADLADAFNKAKGKEVCRDDEDAKRINFDSIDDAVDFEQWRETQGGVKGSPAFEAWKKVKAKVGANALVLSRVGDYYEVYNEDADAVHALLPKYRLTELANGGTGFTRGLGFPHDDLAKVLPLLVRNGHRMTMVDNLNGISADDVKPLQDTGTENRQEKRGQVQAGASRPASKSASSGDKSVDAADVPKNRINDFGEKIGGARKDMARGRIRDAKKMSVKDLNTLKKGADDILSQANILRLHKDGQMDESTAKQFLAFNNVIKSVLSSGLLKNIRGIALEKYRDAAVAWEEGNQFSFDIADRDLEAYKLTRPNASDEKARESLVYHITDPLKMYMATYDALNYPAEERKVGRYVIVDYSKMDSPHVTLTRHIWVKNGYGAHRGYAFDNLEDAVTKMKALCPVVKEKEKKSRGEKAEHGLRVIKEGYWFYVKSRNIPGNIYLSPRFYSEKQAQAYLDENIERLKERDKRLVDALMGSNIGMAEREGVDYRNGKDVTPQDFLDEFGFRGVEFGNWVPQGERQMYLNKTYDAIKDFCAIVGISPKAFSLGGRLGLAFGARGHSRAMAHYETAKEVINLTRMSGVGSLAHEWFHAIDNYLAKQKTGNMSDMATVTHDVVRDELSRVFKDMYDAMRSMDYHRRSRSAGEYWGRTEEEFARLFENYIYNKLAAKEATSPVLVRKDVLLEDVDEQMRGSWPYPSAEENARMEPHFDRLFNTIQEKTDDNGHVILFQKAEGSTISKEADAVEAALRDGLIDVLRGAGIEVVTDDAEAQRELAVANGQVQMQRSQGDSGLSGMAEAELDKEYLAALSVAEKPSRIEKLRNSAPVNITKADYDGKYALNASDAQSWIKDNLRGEHIIKDTGEKILISKVGAEEVTSHNRYDDAHLKSISSIPRMLENAIFIEEQASTKPGSKFDSFRYYVVGLTIDGVDYTAKIVVGLKDGKRYYDHRLTQMEKTKLIDLVNQPASDFTTAGDSPYPPYVGSKDNKLVSLLQTKPEEIAEAEAKMREILDEMKRRRGYSDDSSYQGTSAFNGAAPARNAYFQTREERVAAFENGEMDGDASLGDFMDAGLDLWDLGWQINDPRSYRAADGERREAIKNLREVVNGKKKTVTMYRSVPTSVKEERFRNGDWVTPSRKYAEENAEIHGWGDEYRIIEQEVPVDNVWWDGNDIAEWGYDNGQGEVYKNTANNRKSDDLVTRDDEGNAIPPSQRYDERKGDTRYFRTADGEAYGFVKDGKIYIDTKIATSETPIHEYSHLWSEALRRQNPEAWSRLRDQMLKLKDLMDYVQSLYPELEGDRLIDEVFARYSGRRGRERMRQEMDEMLKDAEGPLAKARIIALFEDIKQALRKFWQAARELFAGNNSRLNEYDAEDFADMMMNDLLNGFNPAKQGKSENGARRAEAAPTFYSNAERAVEGVKQNKANAEQWKAMLTKAGGIKSGEDKWMGLSQWLDEHKGETLTKDEVLQFVRDNGIRMEENIYGELQLKSLQQEFDEIYDNIINRVDGEDTVTFPKQEAWDELRSRYHGGDDFDMAFSLDNRMRIQVDDEDRAGYFLGTNPINMTRLDYTTEGLENKREIAFVVPEVEPFQESDEVHFGPENQGKAVMWVRFGEATDTDGNRVLVIDEIQSNRHQEGRERGYRTEEAVKEDLRLQRAVDRAQDRYDNFTRRMGDKYNGVYEDIYADMTDAERAEAERLERAVLDASETYNNQNYNDVPAAPFEKNWHEVAMKRMLRLAAEEGFDRVAWTTGAQQAERYNIGNVVKEIDIKPYPGSKARAVTLFQPDGEFIAVPVDENGIVEVGMFGGHRLEDVVGKEIANRILNVEENTTISGDGLRLGGAGMKGFYDQMLPRFMDKYGKRWGVKTGEVTLNTPGKEVMHSVDVNDAMRRSVMEDGQPLFQKVGVRDNIAQYETTPAEDNAVYSLREDAPPQKTGIGYKVFVLKDGKLYPPMVANPGGEATPVGVWLNADAAPVAGLSKTGRQQVKAGGKGTQGGSGQLAYRPGWHLGEIPFAIQFNRKNPETGEKELFPANFVWAEVEYAADVDYQEEAMSYGMNPNGNFQHSLAGLPRVPENGSYRYRTNPNPETDPWIITGAMKVNRILKPSEVDQMVSAAGREPQKRQDGAVTDEQVEVLNAEFGLAMQQDADLMRKTAEQMGTSLNTPVNVITDVNTITHPNAEIQQRRRNAKGWYDTKTHEVNIVLSNNRDVEEIASTVAHETIAHKGLRELVGEERYEDFLDETYKHLRDDLKKGVDAAAYRSFMGDPAKGYDAHRRTATDELFGRMAEKPFEEFSDGERTLWQKMCHIIRRILDKFLGSLKLPKWFTIGDNEIRYMLWRSKERLERGKEHPIDVARDVVKREELGLTDDARYMMGDSPDTFKARQRRAVERKGVVMPGLNSAEVKMVDVPRHPYIGNIAEATQQAIDAAKAKYVPDGEPRVLHYDNHGAEFDYSISSNAIEVNLSPKHQAKSVNKGVHLALAEHIDEVINESIEVEEHPDYIKNENGVRDTQKINGGALMHRFYGVAIIDGKPYRVMTLMREDARVNKGNGVHAYEVQKIEVLDEMPNTSNGADGLNSELEASSAAAKILQNVEKAYDSGKKLLDESKIADEDTALYSDGDDTSDIWKDQSMGLHERITAAATRLAANHSDNRTLRDDAMRAIGGNLSDLRKAMSLQRKFDMSTVKRVSDLARVLMDGGYLSGLSQQEVKRLLAAVKNSVGHNDIESSVQKVMDIMVDNQLKTAEYTLHKLETIKGSTVDARGVEVQGQLDPAGQHVMKVFKKTRSWEKTKIEEEIANQVNRMGSDDAAVADEAAQEYVGLQLALEYAQNIKDSKVEEQNLRDEIRQAHAETSEDDRRTEAYRQYVGMLKEAIRQNKIDRAQSYFDLVARLTDSLRESIANAKAFKEAEKQRIRDIQHNANSDMEGRPSDEHQMPANTRMKLNNLMGNSLFAPLATYMEMLRLFGGKSANGEGYLFNRFGRGWIDARQKEITGVREKFAILDAKAKELFGGKVKTWGDLIRRVGKLPKGTVTFMNGGEMQEHELTQGNLLYIYMVNKMLDGRMKLRKMGITDDKIAEIEQVLDPRLIELADWLQEDFLVGTRNEYNETHKRVFGASMAAIEDYFPLLVLENALHVKAEDLDKPKVTNGISTITGSIIKRRVNTKPLDILNADALHVILDHVAKMENWNAYAEFNRDLNTLRSYSRFRNQVQNMTTIYGSGKDLWKKFNDVCQMATGKYDPKGDGVEKAVLTLAQGVTAAKVSFRLFTALKQFASLPAYFPYIRADYLASSMIRPDLSWSWCMKNLPIFNERWKSRVSGDPRLAKSILTAADWRQNMVVKAARAGMVPNAFVDAVTVSIGAHAVYKTRLGQYLRDGYSQSQAERRAIQDAEIVYNETQQSGEGAFTSTMQTDRTWWKVMFSIFRNASMAYQRQLHGALRDLGNVMKGGVAARVSFMKKQMMREGIDEASAESAAKRKVRRQFVKDGIAVATFGYILQLAWNMFGYLPYLIFGDDEQTKDEFWDDIWAHTMGGWLEGLTGGDVISLGIGMLKSREVNEWKLKKEMPLTSDLYTTGRDLLKGEFGAFVTDATNLVVQSGIGVNPQTITDGVLAIMDACGDDPKLAHEATLCIMRILQVPQSQLDKMYFDELGLSGDEVSNYTPEQLAARYAHYKVKRGQFFAPWSWDDEERIKKNVDKANKTIKERTSKMGDYNEKRQSLANQ